MPIASEPSPAAGAGGSSRKSTAGTLAGSYRAVAAGHRADADVHDTERDLTAQVAWLRMRMRAAAPQTLLVAE